MGGSYTLAASSTITLNMVVVSGSRGSNCCIFQLIMIITIEDKLNLFHNYKYDPTINLSLFVKSLISVSPILLGELFYMQEKRHYFKKNKIKLFTNMILYIYKLAMFKIRLYTALIWDTYIIPYSKLTMYETLLLIINRSSSNMYFLYIPGAHEFQL